MNYLELLQSKASEHEEKEMCWSLNYLVGFDKDGDYCEINGSESYCDDCIYEKIDEIQKLLEEKGSKHIHKEFDCSREDVVFTEIGCSEESCPESDDFESCYNCGKSIHTGVLHTFNQELEHYLSEDQILKISDLSNCDCFRINELITSEDALEIHPELVEKLNLKLKNQNDENT